MAESEAPSLSGGDHSCREAYAPRSGCQHVWCSRIDSVRIDVLAEHRPLEREYSRWSHGGSLSRRCGRTLPEAAE